MQVFQYKHWVLEVNVKKVANPQGHVLFLPGFSGDCHYHNCALGVLQHYNYYALSYPGHGRSVAHSSTEFNLNVYLEIINAFINAHKLTSVIVIGHSMGGALAMLLYQLNPQRISKIFLIGPVNQTIQTIEPELYPLFFPRNYSEWLVYANKFYVHLDQYLQSAQYVQDVHSWINLVNSTHPYALGYKTLGPSLLADQLLAQVGEVIASVTCPFWMVYGEYDKIVNTPVIGDYYHKLNSNCVIKVLKNCDHTPWMDDHNLYLTTLSEFLRS